MPETEQTAYQEAAEGQDQSHNAQKNNHFLIFCCQVWPRLSTREIFLKRVLMACCLKACRANPPHLPKSFLMAHDPSSFYDESSGRGFLNGFYEGIYWTALVAWTAVYSGLVLTDIAFFRGMSYCNQSGVWQILLGLSSNQDVRHASLTSTLGADRPDLPGFWMTLSAVYGLPLVVGLIMGGIRLNRYQRSLDSLRQPLPVTQVRAMQEISESRAESGNTIDDNSIKIELASLSWQQLIYKYDHVSQSQTKDLAYQEIVHRFEESKGCDRLRIAYALWSRGIVGWNTLSGESIQAKGAKSDYRGISVIYQILFPAVAWLAWFNYYRMMVTKAFRLYEYESGRANCSDERVYAWSHELGGYDCFACDWDVVDLGSRYTAEGCLDRLLAYPRDPDTLQERLSDLKAVFSESDTWDWSQQAWLDWSIEELNETLSAFQAVSSNVSALNMSLAGESRVSKAQASVLTDYIASMVHLRSLDISGSVFSIDALFSITQSLAKLSIQELRIDRSQANASGALLWMNALVDSLNVLSMNQVFLDHDAASIQLLPRMTNNQTVFLQNNNFNQTDIEALSEWLGNSSLSFIDLTGTPLGEYELSSLFDSIKHVPSVSLASTGMDDAALVTLADSWLNGTVSALDISHNDFSADGFSYLQAVISTLSEINLGYNDISGSLGYINQWLNETQALSLDLSGILMMPAEKRDLLQILLKSTLSNLTLNSLSLTDDDLLLMLSQLGNETSSLSTLRVANNLLSNESLSSLFSLINQTQIAELSISGNDLSYPIHEQYWSDLLAHPLRTLDVSGTNIAPSNTDALASVISVNDSLHSLSIANNLMTQEQIQVFLKKLRYEPECLGSIPFENNIDYNHLMQEYASSDTALTHLDISGVNTSVANLEELCLELPYIEINISNLRFDQDQLDASYQVGVNGCPAAVATAGGDDTMKRHLSESNSHASYLYYFISAIALAVMVLGAVIIRQRSRQSKSDIRHRFTLKQLDKQGGKHDHVSIATC